MLTRRFCNTKLGIFKVKEPLAGLQPREQQCVYNFDWETATHGSMPANSDLIGDGDVRR